MHKFVGIHNIIIEYTYICVHEKCACDPDTKLAIYKQNSHPYNKCRRISYLVRN